MKYDVVKIWQKPEYIGELRKGLYYINLSESIFIDEDLRTIWVRLSSIAFSKNSSDYFNIPIERIDTGTPNDFRLISFPKVDYYKNKKYYSQISIGNLKKLFSFFDFGNVEQNNNQDESIEQEIKKHNFIFLTEQLEAIKSVDETQQQLPKKYSDFKKKITKDELNIAFDFINLIKSKSIRKAPINDLITNEDYSLIMGNLSPVEELNYLCGTEVLDFKKHEEKKVLESFDKHFAKIKINNALKNEFFNRVGMEKLIRGEKLEYGGIVLLDFGGTGKSLLKEALRNFIKDMGGAFVEKDVGDISSYMNSGPQTIQRWYRGSKVIDYISTVKELDLVAEARKNKVPSYLVIDEAEDLIEDENKKSFGKSSLNTINSLKKFIQHVNKGGVVGYVGTILIANMTPENVDQTLLQGGERLKGLWLGQPNINLEYKIDENSAIEQWVEIIEYIISESNLKFEKNTYKPKCLAKLLFYNLRFIDELLRNNSQNYNKYECERFGISPRMFGDFVNTYYDRFSNNIVDSNNFRDTIKNIFHNSSSTSSIDGDIINFGVFLSNIINSLLLPKIRDHFNENLFNQEYVRIIEGCRNEENNSNDDVQDAEIIQKKIEHNDTTKEDLDNSIIFLKRLLSSIQSLSEDDINDIVNPSLNHLDIIQRNLKLYLLKIHNNSFPSGFDESIFDKKVLLVKQLFDHLKGSDYEHKSFLFTSLRKLIEFVESYIN